MFRNLFPRVRRELLRLTVYSQRQVQAESRPRKCNGNHNSPTIVPLHINVQQHKNGFDLKKLFAKWRERFQSSSKDSKPIFKDELFMWCTGMLCLSSIIVGHKWAQRNNKSDCPVHQMTKIVVIKHILDISTSRRLLFAINPDNVKSYHLLQGQLMLDEVAESFKVAADECNGSLLNHLAIKLAEEQQHDKAFQMFQEASSLGNVTALYNVGISYEHGMGTKQSYKNAAECYEKAGNNNHVKSLYNLASLCYEGFLGDCCQEKGFRYAKKAADLGLKQAQLFVGLRYTEINKWNEAFKYFQMAAQQDDETSMFNLAICYENGFGTQRDISKAMELYRQSAARGHVMSQFCVADSYQYGSRGVGRNLKESIKWFQLAKKNGHTEADLRIEHIRYELKQKSEDELLTLLESNPLIKIVQPIKLIVGNKSTFHKSSSMPSLQNVCNSLHNNDNHKDSIASSMKLFNTKTFHKSLLL